MSLCFSVVHVEKRDNMGKLLFSSGKLHQIKGAPESSVRSYLYSIRDNLGYENAHAFPLSYYKYGKNNTRY